METQLVRKEIAVSRKEMLCASRS